MLYTSTIVGGGIQPKYDHSRRRPPPPLSPDRVSSHVGEMAPYFCFVFLFFFMFICYQL